MSKHAQTLSGFILGAAVTLGYLKFNSHAIIIEEDTVKTTSEPIANPILPFGHHGPINDLLERQAYGIISF